MNEITHGEWTTIKPYMPHACKPPREVPFEMAEGSEWTCKGRDGVACGKIYVAVHDGGYNYIDNVPYKHLLLKPKSYVLESEQIKKRKARRASVKNRLLYVLEFVLLITGLLWTTMFIDNDRYGRGQWRVALYLYGGVVSIVIFISWAIAFSVFL